MSDFGRSTFCPSDPGCPDDSFHWALSILGKRGTVPSHSFLGQMIARIAVGNGTSQTVQHLLQRPNHLGSVSLTFTNGTTGDGVISFSPFQRQPAIVGLTSSLDNCGRYFLSDEGHSYSHATAFASYPLPRISNNWSVAFHALSEHRSPHSFCPF